MIWWYDIKLNAVLSNCEKVVPRKGILVLENFKKSSQLRKILKPGSWFAGATTTSQLEAVLEKSS